MVTKKHASLIGLLVTAVILVALVLFLESTANGQKPGTTGTCQDPIAHELATGILMVRGHMHWFKNGMGGHRALAYSKSALSALADRRHKWLDPALLLGVAAVESDFRHWRRANRVDCGICQTRVTVFYRGRAAERFCQRLLKSPALSFQYAARELTHYRRTYCRKETGWRQTRCVLNTYNQGIKYLKTERCRSARCKKQARYWIRVLCFARGIEERRRPKRDCRKARSRQWIDKVYN